MDFPTFARPTCRDFQLAKKSSHCLSSCIEWREAAYDTTLQVVTRTAQKDLLLLDGLLGRHFLLFGVGTGGGEGDRATKQAVKILVMGGVVVEEER